MSEKKIKCENKNEYYRDAQNQDKKDKVSLPNKDQVIHHFYIGLRFFTCLNINKVHILSPIQDAEWNNTAFTAIIKLFFIQWERKHK